MDLLVVLLMLLATVALYQALGTPEYLNVSVCFAAFEPL